MFGKAAGLIAGGFAVCVRHRSTKKSLKRTPTPLASTVAPTQKSTTRKPAVVTGANRKTLFNLLNRGSHLNH
jgi:hypothetical protein